MTNTLVSILFITLMLGVEFLIDIIIKKWNLGLTSATSILIAFLMNMVAFALWIVAMRFESFSKAIFLYSTLSIIGGSILGVLIFSDKMSTLGWLGVVIGTIGVILVSIG